MRAHGDGGPKGAHHRGALAAQNPVVPGFAGFDGPHRGLKLVNLGLRVLFQIRPQRVNALERGGGVEELLQFLGEETEFVDEILVVLPFVRVNGESA